MRNNVGKLDRSVRIVVGLGLVMGAIAGLIGAWGWIGLLPLVTGIAGTCPVYSLLGVDTCSLDRR